MISLVIPVYNFAPKLAGSISYIRDWSKKRTDVLEILFVNDGSTDGSGEILEKLESPMRVITLNSNQGKGAAVKVGVLEAKGDHVFFTDIDLPYDLSAIDTALREFAKGADVVSGSRYISGSTFIAERRVQRKISSKIFSWLANRILLKPVLDTQCGLKGFVRPTAWTIFNDLSSSGYAFDVEVFFHAQNRGYKIAFVPVTLINDSTTSVRLFKDGLSMALALFKLYVRTRTTLSRRDMRFVATIGVAVALLLMPLLQNVGILPLLMSLGIPLTVIVIASLIIVPLLLLGGSLGLALLPLHKHSAGEFSRYAVVGAFNTALNAAIFNTFILFTGISSGPLVTVFALVTYVVIISQAFLWNIFWTFHHAAPQDRKRQYIRFFAVTSTTALVNLGIIHFVVNVIGAPFGITPILWANIALLFTIVTAIIGNFLGYKFFVFAK